MELASCHLASTYNFWGGYSIFRKSVHPLLTSPSRYLEFPSTLC